MISAEDPALALARRLRALRQRTWPGKRITQQQLAEAFDTSVPLISSWESTTNPKIPPLHRLEAYATFFATERSVAQTPPRIIPQSHLTTDERTRRDELLRELTDLSTRAQGYEPPAADPLGGSQWRFAPGEDVIIVCSKLPDSYLRRMPYADPAAPDYVELYQYADLDALLELHGHIRAANPTSYVHVRTPGELHAYEYARHLVLLGGVDWNAVTKELLVRLDMPVRQLARETEAQPGGFEVVDGGRRRLFPPVLRKYGDRETLEADVAHFYRSPNPFNEKRTVTICNGMYQRGTLGAVRALTDPMFRERNDRYVRTRFAGQSTYSIISRVQVVNTKVVTPDWTRPEDRLHEWPGESA